MIHIDHVDKVEGEQQEEEAGELDEHQGHGVVVLVLHLGQKQVDYGVQGEEATMEEKEGAEDSHDNAEDDVERSCHCRLSLVVEHVLTA